ncbi:MAG: phosphotransferase [Micrococcales bacterium]|nr:phosphotransferase [Micrococcales bacterium]MCL2667466.1 phosphotransferase [Micrococcales bacterium]
MLNEHLVVTCDETLDPALVTALEPWLCTQRWFPLKGSQVQCSAVGGIDLETDPGSLRVRVLVVAVRAEGSGTCVTLQVPLVLGDDDTDPLARVKGLNVHDGVAHPAFVAAWLARAQGPATSPAGEPVIDSALLAQIDPAASQVVTAEQSNTSVILAGPGGPVGILKVIRSLAPGENPDVDVPRRLVDTGWDGVPAPLGWLCTTWPSDPDALMCLGVVAQFVPDAADGFSLACDYASADRSFETLAADLGTLVAAMHRALLDAYGPDDDTHANHLPAVLHERFAWAVEQVPALADHSDAVSAHADALAASTDLPARQRVHGDLHLGQVLRGDDRWYVTDFEGEPLAPLEVRTRPDIPLRDVAGVLRSFDYAAAVGGLTGSAADEWVHTCREAFWEAYCEECDDDSVASLLEVRSALELDKVLYEVVYESRNRPDWLAIPTRGLDRLLA